MSHPTTIDRLTAQIESYPQEEAACFVGDQELSYGWLANASKRLSGYLHEIGVGRGDRVAIWLPNSFEWVVSLLAVGSIGAILVPINARFEENEAAYVLQQSGSKVLITQNSFAGMEYRDKVAGWFPGLEGNVAPTYDKAIPSLERVIWVGDHPPPAADRWGGRFPGRENLKR